MFGNWLGCEALGLLLLCEADYLTTTIKGAYLKSSFSTNLFSDPTWFGACLIRRGTRLSNAKTHKLKLEIDSESHELEGLALRRPLSSGGA